MNKPALEIEYRPTSDLSKYERNARLHSGDQIDQIIRSITEFGFTNPLLIDESDTIIAGHGRHEAAIKMGLEEVPTICLAGLTDEQRRAYVIADNKIALNGGWDKELLTLELDSLKSVDFDASLTGFSEREIQRYESAADREANVEGKPAPPEEPVTQFGQLIELGPHRLICGDCRDADTIARLMDGEQMAMSVSSPPYASQRRYDEDSPFKPVPPEEYSAWFKSVADNIAAHLAPDGSMFVNIKEHCADGVRVLYVKELVIDFVREWGWNWVEEYVWTHGGTPRAPVRRFKNGWEPIFHFTRCDDHKFRPDAVAHESNNAIDWGGGHPADQDGMAKLFNKAEAGDEVGAVSEPGVVGAGYAYPTNVLRLAKNMEKLAHGAMYPVKLPEFFVRAFSDPGDIVFDPFLGSGTTIIAADKWKRRGFATEISPAYCDVAVDRWERYTGEKAVRHEV